MNTTLLAVVVFIAALLWCRIAFSSTRSVEPRQETVTTRSSDIGLLGSMKRRIHRPTKQQRLSQVSFVASAVAARLQSGATVTTAWQLGMASVNSEAAQRIADGQDVVETLRTIAKTERDIDQARSWLTLARMTALAVELGSPLAEALEHCAQGIDEQQAAAAARSIAFAGPRSSAMLLSWLPIGGLGLGFLMGIDPVSVLTDGSWGSVCGILGIALIGLGRLWTSLLIRQAERRSQ